jgi:ureidoacrylate peracid hydrolase
VEPYVTEESLAGRTSRWLQHIECYNRHSMQVEPRKAALLVIDMQRFFLDTDSSGFTCSAPAILPTVKRVVEAFRAAHRPVVYTRHVHHPDGLDAGIMGWWWQGMCVDGTPESEIHPDLAPLPGEKVVLKHRYSAFFNTDLDTVLRCLEVEDLVVTGVMTNLCCESTARDAYYRDYRVFFLADGTGAVCEEMHQASLLNLSYGFAFVTDADHITDQLRAREG